MTTAMEAPIAQQVSNKSAVIDMVFQQHIEHLRVAINVQHLSNSTNGGMDILQTSELMQYPSPSSLDFLTQIIGCL